VDVLRSQRCRRREGFGVAGIAAAHRALEADGVRGKHVIQIV
jgi:hypothetical protein